VHSKTGLFVIRQERRQGRRKGENDIKIESRAKKLSGMFDSNIWEIFRYFRILGGFPYHCTEGVYRTRVMRMINKSRSYLVKITGYPLVRSVHAEDPRGALCDLFKRLVKGAFAHRPTVQLVLVPLCHPEPQRHNVPRMVLPGLTIIGGCPEVAGVLMLGIVPEGAA